MALFAGMAVFMFARRLMPGFGEVLITEATAPAMRDEDALARFGEVGDGRAAFFIEHERADGNLENRIVAGAASAVRTFAVAAAVGFEFAIVAIAKQRVV